MGSARVFLCLVGRLDVIDPPQTHEKAPPRVGGLDRRSGGVGQAALLSLPVPKRP
jgi:hypothetical protein